MFPRTVLLGELIQVYGTRKIFLALSVPRLTIAEYSFPPESRLFQIVT